MQPNPPTLTGKQRRFLRALAHDLKAIVQIGHAGLTEGVVKELGLALESHELCKVRVGREAPADAAALAQPIADATGCHVAQVLGHTLVLYRQREEDPDIELPH